MLSIIGFNSIINSCKSYVNLKVFPFLKKNILSTLANIVYRRKYDFFIENFSGEISARFIEITDSIVDIIYLSFFILTQSLTLIFAIYAISLCNIELSELFLLITLIFLVFGHFAANSLAPYSKEFVAAKASNIAFISDFITNVAEFKLYNQVPQYCGKFHEVFMEFAHKDIRMQKKNLINGASLSLCAFMLEAGSILLMLWLLSRQTISIGDCIFIILLALKITEQVWLLSQNAFLLVKFLVTFNDAFNHLAIGNLERQTGKVLLGYNSWNITFKDVEFSHNNGVKVLNGINFTVSNSEKVAILGASGSGKSTLLQLIPKLFDVNSGEILLNGININHLDINILRKNITFISQHSNLLHRTIRENILFGNPNASEQDIITAAKHAKIHDYIEGLESGYDTLVGDNGQKLSGGQKQRIIIARGIVKNSPIIVMDEATSALDKQAEQMVMDSLFRVLSGRTFIISTHSSSFLAAVDTKYRIEHGKLLKF